MTQIVRFQRESTEAISWGVATSDGIRDLGGCFRGVASVTDAISNWDVVSAGLDAALKAAPLLADAKLLSPLPEPPKIICIGLNYRDHAIESGMDIPTEPVVFNKFAGTICGPETVVPLPQCSEQVDYEAELVAVIGRRAWQVSETEADKYIFGYACGHDVSARDWQIGRPGGQWLLGKSFPKFAPLGPYLVPASEVGNPCDLGIRLRLNGELMQDSSTKQLIFTPAQLVAHLSQCCVLEPGDVIFTGTPPGVGMARKPARFLREGDVAEVEIDGLGVLRNSFAKG